MTGKMGFTGTRQGMSERQKNAVWNLLKKLHPSEFHHGDCVGADKEAHDLVREMVPSCKIIVHPANILGMSAGCIADVYMPTKDPLERNKDIVNSCQLLVATPATDLEVLRSGTWMTIRYARREGCFTMII